MQTGTGKTGRVEWGNYILREHMKEHIDNWAENEHRLNTEARQPRKKRGIGETRGNHRRASTARRDTGDHKIKQDINRRNKRLHMMWQQGILLFLMASAAPNDHKGSDWSWMDLAPLHQCCSWFWWRCNQQSAVWLQRAVLINLLMVKPETKGQGDSYWIFFLHSFTCLVFTGLNLSHFAPLCRHWGFCFLFDHVSHPIISQYLNPVSWFCLYWVFAEPYVSIAAG